LAFGTGIELFGCDVVDPCGFEAFHSFAGLRYVRLEDPVRLPYQNGTFDLVIASGVLEHCPLVGESLNELHRVLRDDGQLVITFFPNQTSATEWIGRHAGMSGHRRLYSRRRLRNQLLDHGFEPTLVRFHQFIPAHNGQRLFGKLWWLNSPLERAWPINALCTNIMAVATKHDMM
jgi:SAM-dependent methyltransferase